MYLIDKQMEKIMDIANLKQVVLGCIEDGREFALLKGKTAYIVQAYDMGDAICRLHNMGIADSESWKRNTEKAVIVPGIWEFEMATFIG